MAPLSIREDLESISCAKTKEGVAAATERLALRMGFEWFQVVDFFDPSAQELIHNVHNAPPSMRDYHQQLGAIRRDPIISRAAASYIPFRWSASDYASEDSVDQETLTRRVAAGYLSGFAAHACAVRSQCCIFVVSTGRAELQAEQDLVRVMADVLLAASYIQTALERVSPYQMPSLRPRELECLHWCIAGKTAKETAKLLGISERTVNQHLGRIMETLGVSTKTMAVKKARTLGLLPEHSLEAVARSRYTADRVLRRSLG